MWIGIIRLSDRHLLWSPGICCLAIDSKTFSILVFPAEYSPLLQKDEHKIMFKNSNTWLPSIMSLFLFVALPMLFTDIANSWLGFGGTNNRLDLLAIVIILWGISTEVWIIFTYLVRFHGILNDNSVVLPLGVLNASRLQVWTLGVVLFAMTRISVLSQLALCISCFRMFPKSMGSANLDAGIGACETLWIFSIVVIGVVIRRRLAIAIELVSKNQCLCCEYDMSSSLPTESGVIRCPECGQSYHHRSTSYRMDLSALS